ncbi:MAG: BrnT family toxin [Oscillospiraceae bacterium]|nr:BrnT family toxin [Oscillospiraceae bacterium]
MFEYDKSKSRGNFEKHGIDFVEAQRLWDDGSLLYKPSDYYGSELRWLVTGMIDDKYYTAVITTRGNDYIRIISVRRARKEEVQNYDKNNRNNG